MHAGGAARRAGESAARAAGRRLPCTGLPAQLGPSITAPTAHMRLHTTPSAVTVLPLPRRRQHAAHAAAHHVPAPAQQRPHHLGPGPQGARSHAAGPAVRPARPLLRDRRAAAGGCCRRLAQHILAAVFLYVFQPGAMLHPNTHCGTTPPPRRSHTVHPPRRRSSCARTGTTRGSSRCARSAPPRASCGARASRWARQPR